MIRHWSRWLREAACRAYRGAAAALLLAAVTLLPAPAEGRVYLQFFETPWQEIEQRLPEIFAHGYQVLWFPPPNKATEGQADVGYAVYDRFDLGDQHQRGTTATRYGTRADLLSLTSRLHRLGGKVVFDCVFNHNGNPARTENAHVTLDPVPIDGWPHTRPLDFHLLPGRTFDGGKTFEVLVPQQLGGGTTIISPGGPGNPEAWVAAVPMPQGVTVPGFTHLVRAPWTDYSPPWEDQNYSLLGLIDFANEQALTSDGSAVDPTNDGKNNVNGLPLPVFVRQPGCPECYPDDKPVPEDIRQYLHRWIRWLSALTDADGYRLDAIKHTPESFFARDFPGDTVAFNQTIQDDYDARRGNSDDNDDDGQDDALIFGESYTGDIHGELARYRKTGMRLLNFPLMFKLLDLFGSGRNGAGDIGQLSFPHGGYSGQLEEFGGLGRHDGVSFAQSHDQLPPDLQADLAYAFVMTRPGDAVVFFDGNNADPKSWVADGRPDALGDLGDTVTKLVTIHNNYARGGMFNRFVDDDAYVYERVVEGQGAVLLVVLHDNIGADGRVDGQGVARFGGFDPRPLVVTAFPAGTRLVDLTGNSPTASVEVLAPGAVTADQRAAALASYASASADAPLPASYGLVPLSVRSGPQRNYAAFAVAGPRPPETGARAVEIRQGGQRVEDVVVTMVGERRTAAGVRVPSKQLPVPRVTGQQVDLQLRVGPTATAAFARIDAGGAAIGAAQPVTGSAEGLWDGLVPLTRGPDAGNDRSFGLGAVDLSALAEGMHLLVVKAVAAQPGRPPVLSTFSVPFLVDRDLSGPGIGDPGDTDGDGKRDADDNCPEARNADQADFDSDGVGDLCDLCPLGPATSVEVDSDGCLPVPDEKLRDADAIIAAIIGKPPANVSKLDRDGNGRIDVVDLVREIDAVHAEQ